VAAAMEQVLSLAAGSVAADDSFMLDAGGNSLSLFMLLPLLRQLAPAIDVADVAVPGDDTPRQLAARINELNNASSNSSSRGQQQQQQQQLPAELVRVCQGPADKPAVFVVHGGNGLSSVGLEWHEQWVESAAWLPSR
jgi:acetyl esterase/lipase